MANEFSGRIMECDPSQLVPRGVGYTNSAYQTCALTGSTPGNTNVPGSAYLEASFEYTRSHLWRNFGVTIALMALYIIITAFASELFSFASGGGGALIFKRTNHARKMIEQENKEIDEEKTAPVQNGTGAPARNTSSSSSSYNVAAEKEDAIQDITKSQSIFTWENVEYTVPYLGGERKLLNKINGYVKPGVMIALMGASGAGKTTLLNTLAQRQRMGIVGGEMLVDGRPLGPEFQRSTGFCEQMDLHDGTATIREALEFSAILRQDRSIPREEKLAYVEKVRNSTLIISPLGTSLPYHGAQTCSLQ